jgi:hypothetical protein
MIYKVVDILFLFFDIFFDIFVLLFQCGILFVLLPRVVVLR